MKNITIKTLVAGSLIGFVTLTTLNANENQTVSIEQKAKIIIENAKVKAKIIIDKAEIEAKSLKNESEKTIDETTQEVKDLAHEALEKSKTEGSELIENTKSLPNIIKTGVAGKYVYSKETVNKTYKKTKDSINDKLIFAAIKYAYLTSSDIHSMKIDVDVKDGAVELFGKVQSANEAEEAIKIALSTKGVSSVNVLFLIKE